MQKHGKLRREFEQPVKHEIYFIYDNLDILVLEEIDVAT